MIKKFLAIIFIVFIVMQFFQPTLPEVVTDNPKDLLLNNSDIDENIESILRTSCYDCHSNETQYPWYSAISPSSILVAHDIQEAREELNFSNWESLSKVEKASVLDDISTAVGEGEMPMQIYTLIHWNSSLSESERQLIVNWADEYAEKLFE